MMCYFKLSSNTLIIYEIKIPCLVVIQTWVPWFRSRHSNQSSIEPNQSPFSSSFTFGNVKLSYRRKSGKHSGEVIISACLLASKHWLMLAVCADGLLCKMKVTIMKLYGPNTGDAFQHLVKNTMTVLTIDCGSLRHKFFIYHIFTIEKRISIIFTWDFWKQFSRIIAIQPMLLCFISGSLSETPPLNAYNNFIEIIFSLLNRWKQIVTTQLCFHCSRLNKWRTKCAYTFSSANLLLTFCSQSFLVHWVSHWQQIVWFQGKLQKAFPRMDIFQIYLLPKWTNLKRHIQKTNSRKERAFPE